MSDKSLSPNTEISGALKLEADNAKLRKALVGLVGADTKAELDGIEAAIRLLPMPDEDRMNTINAIHALRDTLAP